MNDNVTYLQPAETPSIAPIVAADRAFSSAWQQGGLKFAPRLQEGLERYMRLIDGCRRRMAGNAQRLAAELTSDPLADIIDAMGAGDDLEFIGVAGETRDAVLRLLGKLSGNLASERHALAALPALDAAVDKQRLLKLQQNNTATRQQLAEEHVREASRAERMAKAIATLEANGLETRFGGVVPSLGDLQKLAAPGGEALVAAETLSKAVEELEVLLGDLIEGMRYAQLQRERRTVRERVTELASQLRQFDQAQLELSQKLAALDELPRLLELCQGWDGAISALCHSLESRQARIANQALANAGDIAALAQEFASLLAFIRTLLEQDRRAL